MWNYAALTEHLRSIDAAEVTMSFAQIDRVVDGDGLPKSARTHQAYWGNSLAAHTHARAWLDAGFTASPNFVAGNVRFTRGAPRIPAGPRRGTEQVRTQQPLVPQPTGEEYRFDVAYEWLGGGEATLVGGRLSMPALGPVPAIYRFELCERAGDAQSYYVGESDNLFKRMNGYRNPGPTQSTNVRMNARLLGVLGAGGSVRVSVVLEATLAGMPLDLAYKPARLVVENVELVRLKREDATIENLGNEP